MMKDHLHLPKDHNSLKRVIEEFNQKFTRRLPPLSHLDENTDSMKDRVRARKSTNTTTPLTPTTPGGNAGCLKQTSAPKRPVMGYCKPQQLSKENISAQKSRIKEAAFNTFGSGSLPPSCKHATPNYTNETRNKWKKAIVSDDSDLFSDNDFYDDGNDEFYEFQKNGGIGKQPIDIPPRTLDFNENERQGNTSDYQPDIDYSYVADMLSDQSDGDSEDEELQHDVDYDAYDMLKTANNVVKEYDKLGPPSVQCNKCHAWMWKEERVNKSVVRGTPVFSLCCAKGQIKLPKEKPTHSFIWQLHNDKQKS
ncbi:hypothetical protein POM88_004197 [Heracleum sosnowskyi]|uniref:Uncharacterized protein n=1 Tax=Heracleum sosnowskyi TaxID=360622 RepID=A0AAD8JL68_9APIA|nr:hypothetical protein POM88_004197 [Heracleum sosnowskyi]